MMTKKSKRSRKHKPTVTLENLLPVLEEVFPEVGGRLDEAKSRHPEPRSKDANGIVAAAAFGRFLKDELEPKLPGGGATQDVDAIFDRLESLLEACDDDCRSAIAGGVVGFTDLQDSQLVHYRGQLKPLCLELFDNFEPR